MLSLARTESRAQLGAERPSGPCVNRKTGCGMLLKRSALGTLGGTFLCCAGLLTRCRTCILPERPLST